jgi:hypothetical protein
MRSALQCIHPDEEGLVEGGGGRHTMAGQRWRVAATVEAFFWRHGRGKCIYIYICVCVCVLDKGGGGR